MNRNFRFMSLILTLMLCFSAAAFGQISTGNIEGTVKDPNGAIVPNASVTVKSTGSTAGFNRTLTTDANGYFIVSNIPPGAYEITTTGGGFKTITQTATVSVGSTTPLNIALEVGSGTTVVDVTTDSSVTLDPGDTKIDTNISKQVIEALPSGTTFTSLLKIAPNVRPEPLAAGFQIDGASGAENVFVIDGQEVTNFRTGQLNANNNIPFELVQEVQIKSTGFEAEYGGATGGVINVVTIGGNDQLRGNFGVSFRPSELQAGPRPILNRYGTTPGQYEYFRANRTGGTDFYPTASLSGPLVKGKLWFSAIYAPQLFETSQTIDYFGGATPNSPVGRTTAQTIEYKTTQRTDEAFIRLDAQPTSKLRVYGTFLYNPIRVRGALPANTEGLTGTPQQATFNGQTLVGAGFLGQQGGRQNSNSVNGQATYTPTSNIVLNFRYGRSFLNEKLGSYGLPRAVRYLCSTSGNVNLVGGPAVTGCANGFTNFANNFQIDYDVSTRNTVDADASFVGVNLFGRHNFKGGTQYNRISNTTSQGYTDTGVVVLIYGGSIANGTGQTPTPGNLGYGYLQRFGTVGEASSASLAFFGQDQWQIGNRLTLNLGIRLEREDVPSFTQTGESIRFNFGDKIAPRLGAAFDLTGDGKTKLFASYGWFYDRFKYELPRGSFGGDFYRRDYFEILPSRANYQNYTRAAVLGTTPDRAGGFCPGGETGVNAPIGNGYSVCQFDFRIPSNLIGASAIDPDIKAARQSEYTVGVERQLTNTMLLSGRYTHKQLDRAVEDIGTFNAQGSESYVIGNPGFGLNCTIAQQNNQPCTRAQRDYDAVEVRIDKRATNYFYNASYTYSRLFGNYSGLASSDEAGRSSPNVNRFFDLPFLGYNADGDPENGRLATDRPHVFKAYGGYTYNWLGSRTNQTTISAFTSVQSGTPITTIYTLYAVTTAILNGRGDLGRTPIFTETDMSLNHRYRFGKDNRLIFEPFIDVRNIFNEGNVIGIQNTISTADIRAANLSANGCTTCTSEGAVFNTILNGAGIRNAINAYIRNPATSAANRTSITYGFPNSFQAGRDVRFGVSNEYYLSREEILQTRIHHWTAAPEYPC